MGLKLGNHQRLTGDALMQYRTTQVVEKAYLNRFFTIYLPDGLEVFRQAAERLLTPWGLVELLVSSASESNLVRAKTVIADCDGARQKCWERFIRTPDHVARFASADLRTPWW